MRKLVCVEESEFKEATKNCKWRTKTGDIGILTDIGIRDGKEIGRLYTAFGQYIYQIYKDIGRET